MEKLSSYISKKVISISDGNQIGYILNLQFDEELKTLEGFIVADDESENVFLLNLEKVKNINNDCVVISSNSDLEFCENEEGNNPLGKIVYDKEGNNLGRIIEILSNGKLVKKIITDKCEFLQRYVYSNGHYVIYGNKDKTNKKISFEAKYKNLPKVTIEEINNNFKINNNIKTEKEIYNFSSPYKIFANQDFLSGRIVKNDIFGYNNELIAKKGDRINNKLINKAKLHNKLSLLIYYSE